MELKESTIKVLQNFAAINPNMVINEGNVIRTMSEARNVVSSAKLEQGFPCKFGIYDLNEFLGVIGLVDNPQLTFNDGYTTISDVNNLSRIKYFYSDPEILTSPTNDVKMPGADIEFSLKNETLAKVKRAASALGHSHVKITPGKDNELLITVFAENNATSNTYEISTVGEFEPGIPFEMIFNINNFKVIPGDYNIKISSKLVSEFTSDDGNIQYWIALEKTSKWG